MKETVITSPISGIAFCYKINQGNFVAYIDYSTGYFSNSLMIDKSEYTNEFEETAPELVKELKFVDVKTKQAWYPMVTHQTRFMIFPEGSKEKWMWCVLPLHKDKNSSLKPKMDEKKYFESTNYLSAVNFADDLLSVKQN